MCFIRILEMRSAMGGTWDQFTYPGIRSDSPMIAFGYGFKPFKAYAHLAEVCVTHTPSAGHELPSRHISL